MVFEEEALGSPDCLFCCSVVDLLISLVGFFVFLENAVYLLLFNKSRFIFFVQVKLAPKRRRIQEQFCNVVHLSDILPNLLIFHFAFDIHIKMLRVELVITLYLLKQLLLIPFYFLHFVLHESLQFLMEF